MTHSVIYFHCRKIFRDALPLLETNGAIGLMRDIISRKEIPSEVLDLWMNSLAFIKNPTQEMVHAAGVRETR